ncbi:MAG: DUF2508 family protein [Epulopiscium sp.]|nr:DUF2508 family protein [Candidatus Epulonipiscium sp.]
MKLIQEWTTDYFSLDDERLISEIERLKKDVEDTKRLVDELEDKGKTVEYTNIKLARLALAFAREKYELLLKEAKKREIFN